MHPSPPVRWLIGSYVAVALSFVGTTLFTQHILRKIDHAAVEIMENASPSIERLAAVRSEIREVEGELDDELDAMSEAGSRGSDLFAARRKLEEDVDAYRGLPRFVGETAASARFFREHDDFARGLDVARGHMDRGDVARAREVERVTIHPAADLFAESTLRLIELNAVEGHALAGHALTWRRQAEVASIVLDAASLLLAAVALALSVSAFRRHTEILVAHADLQKRRGDELEAFAARVAHDITSPLSGAKLGFDAALRKTQTGGDPTDYLKRGLRSLTQTAHIVDGLYAFASSGASPDPKGRADVAAIVHATVDDARPLADAKQIDLVVDLGAAAGVVVACAPGVLASLVSNLVNNAVKYIGDAATKRITVRVLASTMHASTPHLRFEVEDTGPGLAIELAPHVFEAYVRAPDTNQRGLGLGLATVKRLAERHGGSVGVRARTGGGTVFWFELPQPTKGAA